MSGVGIRGVGMRGNSLAGVIRRLFANNEQGAWYDPQDFSQYTNQLGSEVVSNGGFSSATDWTVPVAGASITGGALAFDGATSIGAGIAVTTNTPVSAVVAGRYYRVTYTIIGGTTLPVSMSVGGAFTTAVSAAGTYTEVVFTTTTGAPAILTRTSVGARTGSVDNVSVQELTGLASATLYQDSAGTTPVTAVEQPVGLMLDKRKGLVLGSELVTNGDFSSGTGWGTGGGAWTIAGGKASITAGTGALSQSALAAVAGKTYQITFTVQDYTAGSLRVEFGGVNGVSRTGAGTYTQFVTATTTAFFVLSPTSACTLSVDNISVKLLDGNHAYQSTSAARPTLRARYNQITYSEQFDNAAWTNSVRVTANTTVAPDGTTTADTFTSNGAAGNVGQSITSVSGVQYTLSVSVKYTNNRWVMLQLSDSGVTHRTRAWFDIQNGVKGTSAVTGSGVVIDYTITSQGNGWYRCTLTATNPITTLFAYFPSVVIADGDTTIAAAGQSVAFWGADLRPTNQTNTGIPAYQRIAAATDYDTVGFPVYIQGNGSSQFMQTAAIDFSATGKMTVWSAVRKLSDAAQGTVMELGTDSTSTSNGAFALFAPASAAANYGFQLRGTAYTQYRATTFTAPVSNVLSVLYDIAGALIANEVFPRVNAAVPSLADVGGANAGTGNFGNHALYLLSRAGTSLWFGGYFYGAIIRGAATSDSDIRSGERYLNQRVKAY